MEEVQEKNTNKHTPEYYTSETVEEKYLSTYEEGLFELEEKAVERYFTESETKILDIGCGTGRTTHVFERMGFNVVGIDLTKAFVNHAQTFAPEADFIAGDACSLPFRDETFQYACFSYNGIDDISPEENRYKALREIHRVLNPGGIFIFSSRNLFSTYALRSFDWTGVRQFVDFWTQNIRQGRLFSQYKLDNTVVGEPRIRQHIRPLDQKQQLRNCGFEVLDVLRTDGILEPYFHHPYYVAQKPEF